MGYYYVRVFMKSFMIALSYHLIYIMCSSNKGIGATKEERGMQHSLTALIEKPLNAKYYSLDQDLPISSQDDEANDFATKLSVFMVSAMSIFKAAK